MSRDKELEEQAEQWLLNNGVNIDGSYYASVVDSYIAGAKVERFQYEEVLADKRRLVREIDVIISGVDGAAKQASLCDLVGPIQDLVNENAKLREALEWQRRGWQWICTGCHIMLEDEWFPLIEDEQIKEHAKRYQDDARKALERK